MEFTRRELSLLAAQGIAASLGPRLSAQPEGRKIGYCAVGLGRVSDNFMRATRESKNSRMVAVVSGHRDKAEKIAADYGIAAKSIYNYDNYAAIAGNKEIDAIYIGLPNSMHREYTIRAAEAGKHVLCEKPMANTPADCQAMIDACRKAGKKLMIGYRCQYEPMVNLRAIELIRSGKLGKVQTIDAVSGFNIRAGEWRLDGPLAGGGPLMDMGIYALNACRYLTGEEPADIKATMSTVDRDGRFKDVEENLTWTMRFPSGILANCATSYGANLGTYFVVQGSKGTIRSEPAWGYDGLKLSARIQGEPAIEVANPEKHPAQFVREADHFSDCILTNKEPKTPGEEGLRDLNLIARIYKSCGRTI